MNILLFKTLWGYDGPYETAVAEAAASGFNGIECPAPEDESSAKRLRKELDAHGMECILEIATGGGYVPSPQAGVKEHLESFKRKLDAGLPLKPRFVTCLGGSDLLGFGENMRFFREAMDYAERRHVSVCFETHRSRPTFHPSTVPMILHEIPDLELTCDFSHWCVVCERPCMDEFRESLVACASRVKHIHLRVGYDQGPQVPDPRAPEYAGWLEAHFRWWAVLWRAQRERGFQESTCTAEFGPDGYLHEEPFTRRPTANLAEVNRWMAGLARERFPALAAS
jgi:sugar phosphate isomerase/epimerase